MPWWARWGPPVYYTHISPLMTWPKKGSEHRRVIMDLSWPIGASIKDGIDGKWYLDGPGTVILPTVEYMEGRLLVLDVGAWMYKTDLSCGYRQLWVDPLDWPFLAFKHGGRIYLHICPPIGLRTSALFMQLSSKAISFIHRKRRFISRPYLDDFGRGGGAKRQGGRRRLLYLRFRGCLRSWGYRRQCTRCALPPSTWCGRFSRSFR